MTVKVTLKQPEGTERPLVKFYPRHSAHVWVQPDEGGDPKRMRVDYVKAGQRMYWWDAEGPHRNRLGPRDVAREVVSVEYI